MINHPFPPKLTLADAEDIRARYQNGESPSKLATEYGIAVSSLFDVVRQRAHAPKIVVPLTSIVLGRLRVAALKEGVTNETFAAALIEGALASLPR